LAYKETKKRSLAKTVTWRAIATLFVFGVSYFYTERIAVSMALTFTAAIINTTGFYVHERVWNSIKWGKFRRG